MKTLFVANIPPDTRESELRELFSHHGTVRGLRLPMDIFSGRCRGFALIDMEGHHAREAMARLDGTMLHGQSIKVREEKPKAKRRGGRR